jgi:hypothetical protein
VLYQLRGRRGLIVAAVALGIPALWIGWPWLVVAGVAPLLIALAPCAIMCGLGLCAMKSSSSSNANGAGSCSKSQAGDQTVASVAANELTNEAVEPLAITAPSHLDADPVEGQSVPQPDHAGPLAGESTNQTKEKFQ